MIHETNQLMSKVHRRTFLRTSTAGIGTAVLAFPSSWLRRLLFSFRRLLIAQK